jgi:hypothetical protein
MAGRDFSSELFGEPAPAQSAGKDFSAELFGEPAPAPTAGKDLSADLFGKSAPALKPVSQPNTIVEAPPTTDTSKPAPYKNRREALDDAVNLLEEGVDQTELKDAFAKMGVPWNEIITHGQKRGSEYFKQTTGPVSKGAMPPSGEIKAGEEPGWLKGTANLFKRVDANLGDIATGLLLQTGSIEPDQAGRVIAANAKRRAAAMPDSETRAQMEEIGKAETYGDAAIALFTNPRATTTMLIESVLTSLPAMAPALVLGPAGAIPAAVMAGLASGGMEYGAVITDVLQDKGIDLLDPNAISNALNNPKIMGEIKDKGAKRGLIVGGFDALSMGLAGRFLKPAKDLIAAGKLTGTAAKKATVAAWSKELSMQMGGGAGGEFAAQKATGDNKPVDVLVEALAGAVTAPLEVRSSLQEAAQLEKQAAFIPSAEQIARPKGFLASEGKPPSRIEPTLDEAGLLSAAPVEGEKPPRPFDDVEKFKLEQIVKRLLDSGQPADSAQRIAAKQVLEERKKIISELVTKPTEDEIEQRVKELIDEGIPPQEALNLAPVQIMEERRADALAQAETQGEQNARQTISDTGGTSVPVVGQPDTDIAAAGVRVADTSGVVPAGQDVAGVATGETVQPVAVGFRAANERENKQDGARETLELGNGAKVLFASDGDTFVKDQTDKQDGVIRSGDGRRGVFQSASELPAYVPESVRQPLMDYANAARQNYYAKNEQTQTALADARAKLEAAVNQTQQTQDQATPAAQEDQAAPAVVDPKQKRIEEITQELIDAGLNPSNARMQAEEEFDRETERAAPVAVEDQAKSDDVIAEEAEISDDVADIVGDITTLPAEEASAETAPKGKRGPKGARQTPEQKAASDERRKQQTNYKAKRKGCSCG